MMSPYLPPLHVLRDMFKVHLTRRGLVAVLYENKHLWQNEHFPPWTILLSILDTVGIPLTVCNSTSAHPF